MQHELIVIRDVDIKLLEIDFHTKETNYNLLIDIDTGELIETGDITNPIINKFPPIIDSKINITPITDRKDSIRYRLYEKSGELLIDTTTNTILDCLDKEGEYDQINFEIEYKDNHKYIKDWYIDLDDVMEELHLTIDRYY